MQSVGSSSSILPYTVKTSTNCENDQCCNLINALYNNGAAQNAVGDVLARWGRNDLSSAEVDFHAFNEVEWTQQQVITFSNSVVNGTHSHSA